MKHRCVPLQGQNQDLSEDLMSTLDKKIVDLREKKAIEDKVRLNERVYQKIIMSQM
jgi:hypothetical protein